MLPISKSSSLFNEISDIYSSALPEKEKLALLQKIFKEIFIELTGDSEMYFSNTFSRFIYISDRYSFNKELISKLNKFRRLSAKALSRAKAKAAAFELTNEHIAFACSALQELLNAVSLEKELQVNVIPIVKDIEEAYHVDSQQIISLVKAIVRAKGDLVKASGEKGEKAELKCILEEGREALIHLYHPWSELWKQVWKGANVNFINLKAHPIKEDVYYTTADSFCILEPDILVDATELAECFHSKGYNVYLYFLKKFIETPVNFSLLVGNLVNSIFDELIIHEETDFNTAFIKALKYKPLQIFSIMKKDINSLKTLRPALVNQYNSLRRAVSKFHKAKLSVEPTFISADYGLQGRLDVLAEYEETPNVKDVVELKSGSAPSASLVFYDGKNPVSVGVWNNHLAQITAYNLLLDSTFPGRTGTAEILYSRDEINPLRNAPNINSKKRELLALRNWIIALEQQIIKGNFSILSGIRPDSLRDCPPFVMDDAVEFHQFYSFLNDFEKDYFHTFLNFIQKEIYTAKAGDTINGSSSGFAALWKDSIEEKLQSYSLINGLALKREMSSFEDLHLYFNLEAGSSVGAFRKGDLVTLYPVSEDKEPKPLSQQLIKGVIKILENTHIIISLRNKLLNKELFENNNTWIAEPDYIDSNNKKLLKSLYNFLKGSKKELLLGLKEPEFSEEKPEIKYIGLTEEQRNIISQALSIKDFYLIQGPPGCGKTSYLLKNIVRFIYENSDANILVTAYTNRASDEICAAIKSITFDFPVIRIGSKDNSEHEDIHLSHLSDKLRLKELEERFRSARVIVSTVSTLTSNPELFDSKEFEWAIVDEASQILEPHIVGILTNVKKFIMIGDEKQLPAVVCQPVKSYKKASLSNSETVQAALQAEEVLPEEVENKHGFNPTISLFERLLTLCKANDWKDAYGMLTKQARMHKDIMLLANEMFYDNKLELLQSGSWQSRGIKLFTKSDNHLETALAKSRIIYINVPREKRPKINKSEASLVSNIAALSSKVYGDAFSSDTFGVISPFRAQCAEIKAALPQELSNIITVDTVERFQGSERDIIAVSFACNYPAHLDNIQSLAEFDGIEIDRKLNVAITRAKKHLILLGDEEILGQSSILSRMIEKIKISGGYIKAEHIDA